jgi:hypothetical protein
VLHPQVDFGKFLRLFIRPKLGLISTTCNTHSNDYFAYKNHRFLIVSEIVYSVDDRSVFRCSLVVRSINYFAHKNLHLWSSKVVNFHFLTQPLTRSFVTMSDHNLHGSATDQGAHLCRNQPNSLHVQSVKPSTSCSTATTSNR